MEWTAAPDVAMWLWCRDAATNLDVVLARVDAAASSWPLLLHACCCTLLMRSSQVLTAVKPLLSLLSQRSMQRQVPPWHISSCAVEKMLAAFPGSILWKAAMFIGSGTATCPAAAFVVAVAAADLKVLGTRHSMASRNEHDLR